MGEIKSGDLNRRVTLLRDDGEGQDDYGTPIEVWTTLATVWASWRRATARETLAAGEIGASVSDIFEIRYSSTVASLNPKDRLTYQGRTYDISGVTEIGFREGMRIEATARADGGE